MSPSLDPAHALEIQPIPPADAPTSSAGRSEPAEPAPDLAAVLTALVALSPEQRHALAALLAAPPSPRPTAPPVPDDSLSWEKSGAKEDSA
jgi:hypothetical protein